MAFITETWLTDCVPDAAVWINCFSLIQRDRYLKIGGGVCAFIKSSVPFSVLNDFSDDSIESLWLHLRPHKLPRGVSSTVCPKKNASPT